MIRIDAQVLRCSSSNTRGSVSRGKNRKRETLSNRKESYVLKTCYQRHPRTSFPGSRQREDPGNEVDPRPLCLLQFVARFLHFGAEVSTKSEKLTNACFSCVIGAVASCIIVSRGSRLSFLCGGGGGDKVNFSEWCLNLRLRTQTYFRLSLVRKYVCVRRLLQGRTSVIVCLMANGVAGKRCHLIPKDHS